MISRLLLFVCALSVVSAQTSTWDKVRVIAPSTELRLATDAAPLLRGQFQAASEADLVLRTAVATQTLLRPQIVSVSVKKQGHRLRNTFIGLGVGLGVGLAVGAIDAAGCTKLLCGLAVPVYGAIGLIGGTATGALWPTGGWRTIYRR
jgi:hypothetical protein